MSKNTIEVYNTCSDSDSTIFIENEETDEEEEPIINCNKTNVFLNFSLELEPFYFNNLSVNTNLIIPLFFNVPYVLSEKHNLSCCNIIDDNNIYYYIRNTLKIPDASILVDLMEIQHNIY